MIPQVLEGGGIEGKYKKMMVLLCIYKQAHHVGRLLAHASHPMPLSLVVSHYQSSSLLIVLSIPGLALYPKKNHIWRMCVDYLVVGAHPWCAS